jgi:hypothetical protein
LWKKLATHW